MPYKIEQINKNIVSLELINDFTAEDAVNHAFDMDPILNRLGEAGVKAQFLVLTENLGKVSLEGRRAFSERNGDPRIGNTAVIGVNRFLKIVAQFITVASGKNNIRFFDDKEKALEWLENSD